MRFPPRIKISRNLRAFSLIELMVGMSVLALIMVVLISILNATSSVTQRSTEKISAFQGARRAFSTLNQVLGQATLNSYWDYDNALNPQRYLRKSELHFFSGSAGTGGRPGTPGTGQALLFQVPLGYTMTANLQGLDNALNACGFYIDYAEVESLPSPPFPEPPVRRYRYQLMQALEPTESLRVYSSATGSNWASNLTSFEAPIAENIILMIAWPRLSRRDDPQGNKLTTNFAYDSRDGATNSPQPDTANQLPPTMDVLMVAIDERSAARYCVGPTPPQEIQDLSQGLFTTPTEEQFVASVERLRERMDTLGLNYRIFTSTIPIRESKMSKVQ